MDFCQLSNAWSCLSRGQLAKGGPGGGSGIVAQSTQTDSVCVLIRFDEWGYVCTYVCAGVYVTVSEGGVRGCVCVWTWVWVCVCMWVCVCVCLCVCVFVCVCVVCGQTRCRVKDLSGIQPHSPPLLQPIPPSPSLPLLLLLDAKPMSACIATSVC